MPEFAETEISKKAPETPMALVLEWGKTLEGKGRGPSSDEIRQGWERHKQANPTVTDLSELRKLFVEQDPIAMSFEGLVKILSHPPIGPGGRPLEYVPLYEVSNNPEKRSVNEEEVRQLLYKTLKRQRDQEEARLFSPGRNDSAYQDQRVLLTEEYNDYMQQLYHTQQPPTTREMTDTHIVWHRQTPILTKTSPTEWVWQTESLPIKSQAINQ